MSAAEIDRFNSDAIPAISDRVAYAENMAAIDQIVKTSDFRFIVAWGKWLGFTPAAVKESVTLAIAEGAPKDAVQKINGRWLRIVDISNDSNRDAVEQLATYS